MSKLREHLERRDLGVKHVVVFVDELNKYAPGDGPDTYVRKMLLDIAERGRYLGLVLFGAQQFRSQVHRRVVGNSGTALFGRMDADELATPGYAVLSPATRDQARDAREGTADGAPSAFHAADLRAVPASGGAARARRRRALSAGGRQLVRGRGAAHAAPARPGAHARRGCRTWSRSYDEDEILRARNATLQARPRDVKAILRVEAAHDHPAQAAAPVPATPLRALPADDPYGL